jgi:hypothetical protein
MLRISFLVSFYFLFISCQHDVDGVIRTNNHIDIIFHDVSNDGSSATKGDFINLSLVVEDSIGNLIFSSKHSGLNGVSSFLYDSSIYTSFYSSVFQNIIEGDSVSFETSWGEFSNCFFKFDNLVIDKPVRVYLRFISSFNDDFQISFINELTSVAVQNEATALDSERKNWDSIYSDIFIIDSMYSRLVTNNTYDYEMVLDTFNDYYVLDYSLSDLNGRVLFSTDPYKPHFFQKYKQGQLLRGFELLLNKYNSGDSICAILPSSLAFYEKGAFSVMIPPYTPLSLKLRIR